MPTFNEGRLTFSFPETWQVIKYDESQWHQQQMKSGLKAMDFLVRSPDRDHYWMEVKDCKGFEADNRPRLSPSEPEEIKVLRTQLKAVGLDRQIKVERKKPFIVDELEEKLRSTLAAILIAQRENTPELQAFQLIEKNNQPLAIILLLSWDHRDFKRLAIRLQQKLENRLRPYQVKSHIVNEHNLRDAGVTCQITRSQQ